MTCHERYPLRLVALTLAESLVVVVVGLMLVAQLGLFSVATYGLMGGLGAILSLALVCTRCRYYGQTCGLGLGRLAALRFRKRPEAEFGRGRSQTLAWSLLALALAWPPVSGIVSFSARHSWPGLALLIIYLGLLVVTALTHSAVVCKRCLMAEHGGCTLGRGAKYRRAPMTKVEANQRKE